MGRKMKIEFYLNSLETGDSGKYKKYKIETIKEILESIINTLELGEDAVYSKGANILSNGEYLAKYTIDPLPSEVFLVIAGKDNLQFSIRAVDENDAIMRLEERMHKKMDIKSIEKEV